MGLDFRIYYNNNLIKDIRISYIRNNHPLFTNLLSEYIDNNTGICKSDMFETVISDIKLQVISELEKDINNDDEIYRNTDFIKKLRVTADKLEDKMNERNYKEYYDILYELNESIDEERDKIYDRTEFDYYKNNTELLNGMIEILNILEEYKNKDNIYYALSY
jgi:vacuolar-type H+-ATPase subunit H